MSIQKEVHTHVDNSDHTVSSFVGAVEVCLEVQRPEVPQKVTL
jgi:hypothetical protein